MSMQVLKPDWPLPDSVMALMTTRHGGDSQPPYDSNNLGVYVGDELAQSNRRNLQPELQLPSQPLWLKQVHGVDCVNAESVVSEDVADAVWTEQPGRVLAIQTADCLPVLFADQDGRAVAAAHAGWRGLLGGVLENTLASLPTCRSEVFCWMGAAIGPCCFEVGDEVRAAFIQAESSDKEAFVPSESGKWLADLTLLARWRLQRAGVIHVFGGDMCTSCDRQRFFSYRRDAGTTGRMASLIWLQP